MKLNESNSFNMMHMVLYLLMLLPIFLIFNAISPLFGTLMFIGWFLGLVVRLATKENRKIEFNHIRQSIPHLNIFHIIMFIAIAFPLLYFVYVLMLTRVF